MHNIVLKRLNGTQNPEKLREMKIIQTKVYDIDVQHSFFLFLIRRKFCFESNSSFSRRVTRLSSIEPEIVTIYVPK